MSESRESLFGVPLFRRGKVRDTYDLGDRLLMIASDRLSAFDVVLPTPIPGKGIVLTQLSRFWFERSSHIIANHLITTDISDIATDDSTEAIDGRAMVVHKAQRIDVECVVRGYLAGSGWKEYVEFGTLAGKPLPAGLRQCARLDAPVFTPALKNDSGHDQNVAVEDLDAVIGPDLRRRLETTSLELYGFASTYASARGIVLADTKFEFGFVDDDLTLIDEILTPDSSRYWDADFYSPGSDQASFDKQFVRDWLLASGWDREPPGPELPESVVAGTDARYRSAFARLTGRSLAEYLETNGRGT